jgi:DNA processing protein
VVDERAYWLAWSQIKGIGPVLLKRIYEQFGSLSVPWSASAAALQQVDGLGEGLAVKVQAQRLGIDPEALLAAHEKTSPLFWTPADAGYPALLLAIADPPPLLYYRGRPEVMAALDQGVAVGVVGTRSPSEYGKNWTRKLTRKLSQNQVIIVSGLAEGIDREAHYSALAASGLTIAVLGTGVDVIYPWSNRDLYSQIAQQGLLVSEHANGTPPDRAHFPRRNRIIAGLCRALLVTEAPARSGALISARLANDYGREVYSVPSHLDNPHGLGCLTLLNEGAHLVLDEETVLKGLGALPGLDRPAITAASSPVPLDLEPPLQQVLAAVTAEPISLDRLAQDAAIATGALLAGLVQLELLGLIEQLPGSQYRRL